MRRRNVRQKEVGTTQTSSGAYYMRSSETIRLSVTIESIPDELLFNILVHLPAKDIYHAARLVCRKWHHMIRDHNFICTHLHHATYGLLYHDHEGSIIFVYVREGEIETYKLMDFKLRFPIWTSCNGLVLEKEKDGDAYVIANPLTDEAFRLPPYPRQIGSPYYIGIGYDAASMTYKVVAAHCVWVGKGCDILTVGVDKSWRFISTDDLSPTIKESIWSIPLINESFMHWHINSTQVMTLNLETEIITETHLPIPVVIQLRRAHFLFSTGRYLSLLISRGELMWEVWEMKPETGEWRMLPEMCLQGQKGKMEELGLKKGDRIIPRGWVKYLEVLAFQILGNIRVSSFIYFYNLVKREISSEKVYINCCHSLVLHKNSLVSPLEWRMLT